MNRFFIRSTIFNLCFYILTGISCILLLPTLILPRQFFMGVVYYFVHTTAFLEKYILGLTYEIRGQEHLPKDGAYIIAAKHQSAYETFKLHILFNDPAIVLKKQLFKIPLWGQYLAKSDPIAIDRSSPRTAIQSLKDEGQRVAAQNRPLFIFPQGTRVKPEITPQEKPYKVGIARLQEATELPIIPMALNTGIFYPRNGWCKKPGRVVFEFLPPINYNPERTPTETLNMLEMQIEEKSARLMDEGRQSIPKFSLLKTLIITLCVIVITYTANWFIALHITRNAVNEVINNLKETPNIKSYTAPAPAFSGFPGKIRLTLNDQILEGHHGDNISIAHFGATSWPFLGMPVNFTIKNITATIPQLNLNNFELMTKATGTITDNNGVIHLEHIDIIIGEAGIKLSGTADLTITPYPKIDITIQITNHRALLTKLEESGIVNSRKVKMAEITMGALEQDGVIEARLTSHDNKIYLGPLKILELPPLQPVTHNDGQIIQSYPARVKPQ